ncbi:predicted protein [Naegleria gruberi]|uniref:Predicted protein n=1 Tax=Naegleria gruberi TaxID=5762 RepID=D2VZN7_NAEGR|nr:uncharacterized protein NAEGRDRAFT_53546 [Naegleria gruberi]EFC37694.1 predicted protein [Naegleria gruberi]|eukprot:XP_002670438.1 predicted protein [Naegleria gruberi strain NEG-M]
MMQRRTPSSNTTTTTTASKPLSQRSSSTTRITSGGGLSSRQPSSTPSSQNTPLNTRGTRLTSASSSTSSGSTTARRANSTNARGTTTTKSSGSNATNGIPMESKPKKLSQERYDKHKTANPFTAKNKFKTTFGGVYEAGGIPCRIHHTAAHMHLSWEKPLPDIPYDPLILTVSDGLRETDHPYIFIVQKAFEEMCKAEEAAEKIIPLLRQITSFIRMALQSKENVIFENALSAVQHLTACVGDAIIPHLPLVLVQISKKTFDKKYANKIMDILQNIEQSCENSAEVVKLIKAKVPTYVNIR